MTVVAGEKHIWFKPMWSIPDASNVSSRDHYSLHYWKSNDDGKLFHKQTRKVLNNYGKSIQTIAYFFSKICELITADGGDPASGYFEEQFKEVMSQGPVRFKKKWINDKRQPKRGQRNAKECAWSCAFAFWAAIFKSHNQQRSPLLLVATVTHISRKTVYLFW